MKKYAEGKEEFIHGTKVIQIEKYEIAICFRAINLKKNIKNNAFIYL